MVDLMGIAPMSSPSPLVSFGAVETIQTQKEILLLKFNRVNVTSVTTVCQVDPEGGFEPAHYEIQSLVSYR